MKNTQNQQEVQAPISDLTDEAKKILKKAMAKLNFLIVGKTGVGKSTLINAVFGNKVAETGSGRPITQEITKMDVNQKFSIYDTKGLEMKDFKATYDDIKNFLEEKEQEEASEQIHIVWFCLAELGRRIEDGERELFELFKQKGYMTIIVITKAQQDMDENGKRFSEQVKADLQVGDEHLQRVMSLEIEDDEGNIKPVKGVKELTKKTYDALPSALKQAFAREQKYNRYIKYEAALSIINKYGMAAGAVIASPIPFSDIALILPTQIAMISHITYIYGFEVSAENIAKLTASFAAVAVGGFAVRFVAGNLIKFIPILGVVAGRTFNATVATSTTQLMGRAYLAYINENFSLIYEGNFDLLKNLTDTVIKAYVEKQK